MPIKAILEKMEDAPEGLQEFYSEKDGGFVLNVEGIDDHPDVSNLRNAYQRVKKSDSDVREELRQLKASTAALPDDFDAELWEKAKSGELVRGLEMKVTRLEKDLTTANQLAEKQGGIIRRNAVDSVLAAALDEANITDAAYREGALAILKDSVKLDGETAYVDSDMGPIDPKEYVKRWAATEKGKRYVSQPSGGGSRSGNPSIQKGKARSEMSVQQRAAFIDEHGLDEYNSLPYNAKE